MQLRLFAHILPRVATGSVISALALAVATTSNQPSYAEGNKFFCTREGNVPVTKVRTSRGNVVTCWHVVQLKGSYTVQTGDGKKYTFNNSQVKRFSGVDLAVFQFTSDENYRVAEKGNSDQVALGTNISVAGYSQGTSDIKFIRGGISSLVTNPKDGYAFVYDIGGYPGMSGGAILDEQGKLVGIHGRATTRPDTNATTVYGIPLKTYLSLAPSVQPVATAPAPTPKPTPIPPQAPSQPVNSNNLSGKFVLQKTLNGHSSSVNSVAISPDGRTLASGNGDNTIKIWQLSE